MGWVNNRFEKNFLVTTVDYVFNWARKSAIWPMTFGLACCAIEMIAASTSRFDIARFGSEVFRPSPRQSDLMIVSGTVTLKMAPVVKRIYDQMPEPKWVMSMGACSSVGGPFNTYAVLQGVDRIVPVDVYVVGCPPRPENLFYGLLRLQDKIDKMSIAKKPTEVRLEGRDGGELQGADPDRAGELREPGTAGAAGGDEGQLVTQNILQRKARIDARPFCCTEVTASRIWCTITSWLSTSCDMQVQARSSSAILPMTKNGLSTRWGRSSRTTLGALWHTWGLRPA